MVGQGRLELPTSRLSVVRSSQLSYRPFRQWLEVSDQASENEFRSLSSDLCQIGGGKETRTPDILLAKQALYQLSYAPSHFRKMRSVRLKCALHDRRMMRRNG